MLFRPIMAEPPLCTLADLKTTLTLDELLDLHEVLDLKEAAAEQARESRENETGAGKGKRR